MDKKKLNIALIEWSPVVCEGIQNVLQKSGLQVKFVLLKDIENLNIHVNRLKIDIILINPYLLVNRLKLFRNFKMQNTDIKWIGLMSSFVDKEIVSFFDEIIQLDDTVEIIVRKVEKYAKAERNQNYGLLTDRERSVLKEIIKGFSNKEIAIHLNISVHTVMSHRKNIYSKTGIKSQSGLTVFALNNNLVSIENL